MREPTPFATTTVIRAAFRHPFPPLKGLIPCHWIDPRASMTPEPANYHILAKVLGSLISYHPLGYQMQSRILATANGLP